MPHHKDLLHYGLGLEAYYELHHHLAAKHFWIAYQERFSVLKHAEISFIHNKKN